MSVAEARLRNRRAVGLVAMSALLPGSAQFVAGNRTLGRWIMRVWLALLAAVLVIGLGLLVLRGPTVGFLLSPALAPSLKVGAWALFAVWVLLLIDAWRLAHPPRLSRNNRLLLTLSCFSLVVAAGFGTNLMASAFTAVSNVSDVFQGGGDTEEKAGRYNVLLLGVDAARGRDGIRPDSINVASVDARTGRTVIFGLPRNLQGVPFPESSPLKELYPDGYRCEDGTCMINGVHTLGEEHADLYPGQDAGLAATSEVVSETLGLEINYYAMVDMGGFQSLVEAMGGIRLDSNRRIPIGGGGSSVSGYIEPGEGIFLDGYHALWYARSRHDSSDYERMVRQKCVMSAMAKQLDPGLVATQFLELSEAGKNILRTDVGAGHVAELAELALRAQALDIESVDMAPPLIVTADPDFGLIRATVADAIAAAEALDEGVGPDGSPSPEADEPAPTESPASQTPSQDASEQSEESLTGSDSDEPLAAEAEATTDAHTDEADEAAETEDAATGESTWICRVS
ncbi:LCP family protein [Tessaracoccus sp. OS52]|uniref:LCP family protein n=1 Tax=Tessaracoccus sp. OS52 TaxID=2886691 RepID=UPI001D126F37|nr:LCP family protein [Tessaracoccus sp. OS52]